MSGGGFLVANDSGLFARAAAALISQGGIEHEDAEGGRLVQFADTDERLFTLYDRVPAGTEWEVSEGLLTLAPGVPELPNPASVVACPFECRWPDLVLRVAGSVARTSRGITWLVDGDGVVWAADAVDPRRFRL